MRAECDYPVTSLQLTGNARDVVAQALDRDRPPGDLCWRALDDPHARPLARIK
jgi:hypothetical protein